MQVPGAAAQADLRSTRPARKAPAIGGGPRSSRPGPRMRHLRRVPCGRGQPVLEVELVAHADGGAGRPGGDTEGAGRCSARGAIRTATRRPRGGGRRCTPTARASSRTAAAGRRWPGQHRGHVVQGPRDGGVDYEQRRKDGDERGPPDRGREGRSRGRPTWWLSNGSCRPGPPRRPPVRSSGAGGRVLRADTWTVRQDRGSGPRDESRNG
jgi:hypothetical protein